jgi:transcriptional regulator with XRE-family HTH domain
MVIADALSLAAIRELASSGRARERRQQAGLSLYDVAAAIGVAAPTVHRWERGHRRPHGQAALRYAALMDALARRHDDPHARGRE